MDFSFSGTPALIMLFIIAALPIILVATWIGRLSRAKHRYKQLRDNVIVAEYDPPGGLSPAEIGYLFDSNFNKTELIATLLDLEQRGFVQITHSAVSGLRIEKQASATGQLKSHERYLLDVLQSSMSFTVYSLRTVFGFKRSVRRSLSESGYFKSQAEINGYYLQRVVVSYLVISAPLYGLFLFGGDVNIFEIILIFLIVTFVTFPFFAGLALVSMLAYNRVVGSQGLWTDKLKRLWPQLQGYREFIARVELDELQFESEDLKLRSKNKTMPYAVALNLNTEWQQRF